MDYLRRKIGAFYLTELVGQGGMSHVYLAVNPRTREKRAAKILAKRATASPISYARFLREIEIIRTLSHPHIVKILDSGILEDCYYYMMELMTGGSLARRLTRGRIPLKETVELFAVVCSAMAHAHEKGIIHRDLKPSNILLNDAGAPMISDFGIAKSIGGEDTALTRSNEILGTIAYLAPEQRFNTKRVDRRADVYALGAILYEMLMGFPPLGKFPWPRETQTGFPENLHTILEKCLALNPDDRYLQAGSLLTDIEQSQEGGTKALFAAQTPSRETPKPAANMAEAPKLDRLECWFQVLRTGTTKERLAIVREMVEQVQPGEAKAILKLFPTEEDRVRWGLIRVLGDLKITAATPMIINELKNPYHRECAIEALGKIGSDQAFNPLREFLAQNPESATIALMPLARTGRQRSLKCLRSYLSNEMATLREAAIHAMATVETPECLRILKEHAPKERDDRARNALQQSIRSLEAAIEAREELLRGKKTLSSGDQTLQIH
jgi:tRNA A-37 threonylcarbamoyl transferase component Bud32